jgi:hypothetical protein
VPYLFGEEFDEQRLIGDFFVDMCILGFNIFDCIFDKEWAIAVVVLDYINAQ